MGFLDFVPGVGSAPDAPKPVPLDPGSQGLINAASARGSQSVGDTAKASFGDAGQRALSLGQTEGQTNQQAASRGEDPSMLNAIRQSYGREAGYGINRAQNQNAINANFQKSQQLSQVAQAALGQQQAITNQNQFITNAYNQQEAARAGFINQLFQTADVGIGMYAGNHGMGRGSKTSNSTMGGGSPSAVGGFDPGAGGGYGMEGMA